MTNIINHQRVKVSIGGVVVDLPADVRATEDHAERIVFGIAREFQAISQHIHDIEAVLTSQYVDPRDEEEPSAFRPPPGLAEPLRRMFEHVERVREAMGSASQQASPIAKA